MNLSYQRMVVLIAVLLGLGLGTVWIGWMLPGTKNVAKPRNPPAERSEPREHAEPPHPEMAVLPSVAPEGEPLPGIVIGKAVYVSGRGALPSKQDSAARGPTRFETWRGGARAALEKEKEALPDERYRVKLIAFNRERSRRATAIREQGFLMPAHHVASGLSRIRFALVSIDNPNLFPVFPEELLLLGLTTGFADEEEFRPAMEAAEERCASYATTSGEVKRLGALCVEWAQSAGGGEPPEEGLTPI